MKRLATLHQSDVKEAQDKPRTGTVLSHFRKRRDRRFMVPGDRARTGTGLAAHGILSS
jgi:hypothetical protein